MRFLVFTALNSLTSMGLIAIPCLRNIEIIGGKIIEVHLRFADQWPDLYGEGWTEAIELYRRRRWRYADGDPREGYSVVLFGVHSVSYRHPPAARVDEIDS